MLYLLLFNTNMARIFLALTPNKELNDHIIELKKGLKNSLLSDADITWQKNSDHHLTLNFVGSMEPEQIEEMYAGISQINFMSHLQVDISSINFFPNEDSQLLVAMVKPTNQLLKIYERIDEVVTRIGFGSSLKTYKPHITLGRFKDKNRTQFSFEDFNEIKISSRVNALDVYESDFDKGRSVYNLLKSFEF
jgi:2'-5' RNA ligase|tara:strand:+ start:10890 stop:11465 length:576 start_codon:yes stop_codon:yes gene_type:complete